MNDTKLIYDPLGELSKLSPEEMFEALKIAGYIPPEEKFENWTFKETKLTDLAQ